MLKFVLPVVAALGLAAASAQPQSNDVTRAGGAPMAWHLSHEGEMAKLAYGAANSDQLAIMITCEPGQAEAVVYGDVKPAGSRLQQASLAAVPIDPLSGGLADELRMPIDDPTLQRLAARGRMAVEGDTGTFDLTADRVEQRMIGRFFSYCGMAQA